MCRGKWLPWCTRSNVLDNTNHKNVECETDSVVDAASGVGSLLVGVGPCSLDVPNIRVRGVDNIHPCSLGDFPVVLVVELIVGVVAVGECTPIFCTLRVEVVAQIIHWDWSM